jgi:hypothetical protein
MIVSSYQYIGESFQCIWIYIEFNDKNLKTQLKLTMWWVYLEMHLNINDKNLKRIEIDEGGGG